MWLLFQEIYKSFLFIWFLIQNVFLSYITHKLLPKYTISYTIDNKTNKINIYKNSPKNSKKYIYFLCGGFLLTYTSYIQKTVSDISSLYPNILDEYNIIVLEKVDKCNLILYDDISQFIQQTIPPDTEEIVFIGFSGGGVVSSHILQRLKHIDCSKKIILYDCAFSVIDTILNYSNFYFYRVDYLMYIIVKNTFLNHFDYQTIKDKIVDKYPYFNGAYEYINMVKSILHYNDVKLYKEASFNFDQTENTKVFNIYSKNDHIISPYISNQFIEKNKKYIKFDLKTIVKNTYGHCSDMAFSTEYLHYIINALKI
jgi:hypothetical protein